MRQKSLAAMLMALLVPTGVHGQTQRLEPAVASGKVPATHTGYFFDPTILDLTLILPPPPAQDSDITKAELADIHRIEKQRTPQQIAQAQADDKEEDIFIFKAALGPNFTADQLPLTTAFSGHVRLDEGAAGKPLKTSFSRPRPYQFDSSLHPVCELTKETNSYPSGHTLSGYLLAFTLVQIVPEKREQIMKRADEYANNRIVCGVHYPSDVQASHLVAYIVFGYMMANPRFQKELAIAREETRLRLGLPLVEARP
jgi:acid phosphatase (class A)